jgi:flagellin-like hook-associated protein FlgL
MTVSGVSLPSAQLIQALIDQRSELDDLSRQLSTGQKVTTYAGISSQAQLLVGLNSQLNTISGFQSNNDIVNSRLSIAQSALTQFDSVTQTVQQSAMQSNYTPGPNGQTVDQTFAGQQLDQLLNLLNTQADNRFVFSGSAVDQQSVASSSLILNGTTTQAGLKQIISERNQADLGANGLGRLVIPGTSTSSAHIIGIGATLKPDAPAVVSGTANIQNLTSGGGTIVINGDSINIPAGSNATAIVNTINLQSGTTNVTASINATNQLVLTSGNANTAVDTTGTTVGLAGEFGLTPGITQPMNLLQQGLSGQSLTITVTGNPPLMLNFGAGGGQISTLAGLKTALAGLTGGTATVDTSDGNISIAAAANNTTSNITVAGTPGTASLFGIQVASASPTANTRVSLSEDVAGSVFGFKLGSVSSTLTNATATGPTGSPASISVDLATNPNPGDTLTLTFKLPDGTTSNLTLTATTSSPPATGQFTIGATPAATAANLQAALTTGVTTLAATDLTAASAVEAAHNFFDVDVGQPPQRVAGPPFTTATALVAGTAANTVTWYTGGLGTGAANARSSVTSRVDGALTVSYGIQANEQALRSVIENVAVFAATSFQVGNSNSSAAYTALSKRVGLALIPQSTSGNQTTVNIETELANAQTSIKTATDQQKQTQNTLLDFVQSITGVSNEEVAAKITTLQTQLQASLQVTAMLTKLSITNYLAPA